MIFYFVVFIVLAAFLKEYPNTLQDECENQDPTVSDIRIAVVFANATLGKTCECYFDNANEYTNE